mmetsp:Transcript_8874/g.13060  ORF Transcript_8874/g.13060 Transcript_8874/m.13060 type:complete len:217 (+) Transcript_8874:93-743(+)
MRLILFFGFILSLDDTSAWITSPKTQTNHKPASSSHPPNYYCPRAEFLHSVISGCCTASILASPSIANAQINNDLKNVNTVEANKVPMSKSNVNTATKNQASTPSKSTAKTVSSSSIQNNVKLPINDQTIQKISKDIQKDVKQLDRVVTKETKKITKEVKKDVKKVTKEVKKDVKKMDRIVTKETKKISKELKRDVKIVSKETEKKMREVEKRLAK